MADGILTITGFSDFKRIVAEYRKLEARVDKLQKKLEGVSNTSRKSDKVQETSLDRMAGRVARLAASYVGVRAAIQRVTAAIQEQDQISQKAVEAQIALADQQNKQLVLQGLRGDPKIRAELLAKSRQLGVDAGLGGAFGVSAVADILSASEGELTVERGMKAFRALQSIAPAFRNPEIKAQAGPLGGAILDLVRSTPGLTPEEGSSMLFAALGQSRITEIPNIKNLVRGVVTAGITMPEVEDRKELARQSLALGAALTARLSDPTAELTPTAVSSLIGIQAQMIRKYAPEFATLQPLAAMEAISKDEKLREAVLPELKGRFFTKIPQSEFIAPEDMKALGENVDRFYARGFARKMLTELDVSERERIEQNERLGNFTPDILMERTVRESEAQVEDRMIRNLGREGGVRRVLFGEKGFFQGEAIGGAETLGESLGRGAARFAYEASRFTGGSQEDAALWAMSAYGGFARTFDALGKHQFANEGELLYKIQRSDPAFSQTEQMKAQQAQLEATRRAAEAAEENVGAANAAAQTTQHRE
jgi:hypothetical protein